MDFIHYRPLSAHLFTVPGEGLESLMKYSGRAKVRWLQGKAAPVWLGEVNWPLFFMEHHFYLKDDGEKNCGYLDLGICKHCLKN